MLDIAMIREKPEWVTEQIKKLNDTAPIQEILEADSRRREIILEEEALRRQRNVASKDIGQLMRKLGQLEKKIKLRKTDESDPENLDDLTREYDESLMAVDRAKAAPREIGDRIAELDSELKQVETELRQHMLWVPNIPHDSVPEGPDDSFNIIHQAKGADLPKHTFELKAHWDLGPELDIIDFERGVKLSGTRFYILKGWGARLQRALIQFMLDHHVENHGYTEVYPPYMVRSDMFEGAAQLPKFSENIYRDAEEDFMWIGTAEIAVTNMHRDEILEEKDLPRNYVAYTACFRREKMSAGRDVRGIKRGHQFDKVEMYKFTTPEDSYLAFEQLILDASDICEALGLPYRLVEMATGDLGFAAAKKYDIEIWAAGCQEWLEVSSISNCEAFQARRANVRYRPDGGGRPRFVHTLNGSGLALPRTMIAIIENYQQADGSIVIPEILRPYMGGASKIS